MSLVHRVRPVLQSGDYSCWWACMRMTLAYYGRFFAAPWHYKPDFRYPVGRPISPDEWRADHDPVTGQLRPYEWFWHGVPMQRESLTALSEITDFGAIAERRPFGTWTTQFVEATLRRHGPFFFIGNWNNQGFHAVLVIGRRITDAGTPDQIDEVLVNDPASGQRLNMSIHHFNRCMSSVGAYAFNPFCYRLVGNAPIRATEGDEQESDTDTNGPNASAGSDANDATGADQETYTVVAGDSLWKIANRFYGDGRKWRQIYRANERVIGKNPNLIRPGQRLRIPP